MNIDRRHLLRGVAAGGLLPLLTGCSTAPIAELAPSGETPNFDPETFDFWNSMVRQPANVNENPGFAASREVTSGPDKPEFIAYSEKKGFTVATAMGDADLPDKGTIHVLMRVDALRLSQGAKGRFENLKSASIRVDLRQALPMPGLPEALAWSAIAGLVPNREGVLPALEQLRFDPKSAWGVFQTVPLVDGFGFWTWNIFMKRKEGFWGKFMNVVRSTENLLFPMLGLPSIGLTALQYVDSVIGYLQAQDSSDWVFQSRDIPVFGTKEAAARIGRGLALRTGYYLVIPQSQLAVFGRQRDKLKLTAAGVLVPSDVDEFNAAEAGLSAMPELTYLSVYVRTSAQAS